MANRKETGVIILGHGSKLRKANNTVIDIVRAIKKRTGLDNVLPAFLQLSQPDLSKSIKCIVNKGCKRIIIVPFFLFSGNHVSRDIPAAVKREAKKHPDVRFEYTKNLGEDRRIEEIVLDRIKEAGCL